MLRMDVGFRAEGSGLRIWGLGFRISFEPYKAKRSPCVCVCVASGSIDIVLGHATLGLYVGFRKLGVYRIMVY